MPPTRRTVRRTPQQAQVPHNAFNKITAQGKMQAVVDKLGIPGLKGQQGTTRTIYHFLPITEGQNPITPYMFFQNVKNEQFPFTNLQDNKLEAGEAIAVERIYFVIMTITTATQNVTNIQTWDQFTTPGFYLSKWDLKIASQDYTKQVSAMSMKPEFNKDAKHAAYNVYHPGVYTVIPPDIQFVVPFTAPQMLLPSSGTLEFWLGCFIEGDASILNMKETL